MPKQKRNQYRCDHCKKFVDVNGNCADGALGTLEGIVSPGVEISFGICQKCFNTKGLNAEYWDKWVEKQDTRPYVHSS